GTERFLLPSRTGIEFVDLEKKSWDINHWVRGACLYGVMPCNGLVYAGPHNCACYPEAKLDGLNALAPAAAKPHPKPLSDEQRLERGPAYGAPQPEAEADATDWPTYRHDAARSGYTSQALAEDLGKAWDVNLGGRLSAPIIAGGKVFVAQVDKHIVHALDAATGKPAWQFTAGGRVDSPPTYWNGRIVFGCKDGAVYCVRAEDGALIWRFYAAPSDRRHMAFEQLESVWPVHGSVLVENGVASFVSGRSVFLDGGLRFYRLDVASGRKLVEVAYNDKDPETGRDLQEHVKTLQMPVGLNDILSSDGKYTYLRSQKIGADGKRIDVSPVSGNAGEQGGTQKGEGRHLFAPMGYLDDSWFHRSYWVYGKHFAGGHNGYYQAGKYTPSGRILVFDDENVYGYGREPKYLKWTTTMEHQLFAASKQAPDVEVVSTAAGGAKRKAAAGRRQGAAPSAAATPTVRFTDAAALDPSNKPLTVEAWILPDGRDGVIVQHGGGAHGYALALQDGKPGFAVCSASQATVAAAARPIDQGWHHVAGVLTPEKKLRLYVDGQLAAETTAPGLIAKKPVQILQIGAAGGSAVSDYGRRAPYLGLIDQFAIFHRAMGERDVADRAVYSGSDDRNTGAVVACSFDNGDARDDSGRGIHGVLSGVETGKGKIGAALWFRKAGGAPPAVVAKAGQEAGPNQGTFVQHQWTSFIPMFTRAMAMAGDTIFVSGPPDTVDEEYAFERMTQKDPAILTELAEQDAALDGKRGASLNAISSADGDAGQNIELESPPVWDGMAIAQGCLFVSTEDGKINCFGRVKK
ncbi:MAG: PQQ-binding-like beta-propeller repeat protein, partial [Verrucomicrobiota bacterium]|nr:PQQ-binding-like beta-propeller repeat protein [Verrucomicrobiota bacterium]